MPMLSARAVWKSYTDQGATVPVLRGVSLAVEAGEFVTICGASGSGKSTLLHILGGLDQPDQGRVDFQGSEIYTKSDRELALFRNRMIGFVFQFYHLLPEFTACENVMFPCLIGGMRWTDARQRAMQLLTSVGLDWRAEHRPQALSGGEQQRVAIVRALAATPKLILADEPTGNLDAANGSEVLRLLRRVAASASVTVILVTHNPELLAPTDRRLILREGELYEAR